MSLITYTFSANGNTKLYNSCEIKTFLNCICCMLFILLYYKYFFWLYLYILHTGVYYIYNYENVLQIILFYDFDQVFTVYRQQDKKEPQNTTTHGIPLYTYHIYSVSTPCYTEHIIMYKIYVTLNRIIMLGWPTISKMAYKQYINAPLEKPLPVS